LKNSVVGKLCESGGIANLGRKEYLSKIYLSIISTYS
ncbi:MAG: hypothetical protein ACI95X_002446, partial [Paraglaciecola sp.]